jgi:hypothetical protein
MASARRRPDAPVPEVPDRPRSAQDGTQLSSFVNVEPATLARVEAIDNVALVAGERDELLAAVGSNDAPHGELGRGIVVADEARDLHGRPDAPIRVPVGEAVERLTVVRGPRITHVRVDRRELTCWRPILSASRGSFEDSVGKFELNPLNAYAMAEIDRAVVTRRVRPGEAVGGDDGVVHDPDHPAGVVPASFLLQSEDMRRWLRHTQNPGVFSGGHIYWLSRAIVRAAMAASTRSQAVKPRRWSHAYAVDRSVVRHGPDPASLLGATGVRPRRGSAARKLIAAARTSPFEGAWVLVRRWRRPTTAAERS